MLLALLLPVVSGAGQSRPPKAPANNLQERLNIAILRQDVAAVKALLKAGADAEGTGFAEALVGQKVDPTERDTSTLLIIAAGHSRPEIVRLLLQHGAKVNARDGDGMTALHWAVLWGEPRSLQVLLGNRANPNVVAYDGSTPLMRATFGGQPDKVKMLLQRQAKVNIPYKDGSTALDWAIKARKWADPKNQQTIISLLLRAGAKSSHAIPTSPKGPRH